MAHRGTRPDAAPEDAADGGSTNGSKPEVPPMCGNTEPPPVVVSRQSIVSWDGTSADFGLIVGAQRERAIVEFTDGPEDCLTPEERATDADAGM